METALDQMPGFRRRVVVRPGPGCVRSDVEDDYHHMRVVVHHDGEVATAVEAEMVRNPWTTCPGAVAVLSRTFTGVALLAFGVRGERPSNCTHLHDIAVLAAAHAHDDTPLVYDILASDPIQGRVEAELRRDGRVVMHWGFVDNRFDRPEALAGLTVMELGPWIKGLEPERQEQARLLRWGCILAHGRVRLSGEGYDPSLLPRGQCFTFQPENAAGTEYNQGTIRDFSHDRDQPLAELASMGRPR